MLPYSPAWFFLGIALLFVLVRVPLFRSADAPPTQQGTRVTTLDGLRGFLALAVFFHHATIYVGYLRTGQWEPPPSRFYAMLGPAGVDVFFMITGFLFWNKMIKENGSPNWLSLYIGRVFRIGPLYVLAVLLMIVVVFIKSDAHLNGTIFGSLKACGWWLMLGMLGPGWSINHFQDTSLILAGVTWTLQYEWYFYAALLPLSLLARGIVACLLVSAGAFAIGCIGTVLSAKGTVIAPPAVCVNLFAAGMLSASLSQRKLISRLPHWFVSTLAALLIAAPFLFFSSVFEIGPVLLLAAAFLLIASGCDLFGLLSTISARRLGDISYGLYLMHGLVLSTMFSIEPVRRFAIVSTVHYWTIIMLCAVILLMVATLALVLIERPGIGVGRRILGRRRKRSAIEPNAAPPRTCLTMAQLTTDAPASPKRKIIDQERLTIAIPTYNRSGLLKTCLSRLLVIAPSGCTILVSDNASSDDTPEIVTALADPRIVFNRNEENLGIFGNLNRCVDLATTPYMIFLSDDDAVDAELFGGFAVLEDPAIAAAVSASRYLIVAADGEEKLEVLTSKLPSGVYDGDELLAALWSARVSFQLCGIVFRVSDLRAIGGFSRAHRYAGDIRTFATLFLGRRIAFDAMPRTTYVIHRQSETSRLGSHFRIRDLSQVFDAVLIEARRIIPAPRVRKLARAARAFVATEYSRDQAEAALHRRASLLPSFPKLRARRQRLDPIVNRFLPAIILPRWMREGSATVGSGLGLRRRGGGS